jgi:hypothetical protein
MGGYEKNNTALLVSYIENQSKVDSAQRRRRKLQKNAIKIKIYLPVSL